MQTGALSPESVNCLIETLDPFHDTNYSYVGLPDARNDHSVVQCVKKTISIKKPAGLPAGDWDVHICSLPERNHYPVAGGVPALSTATTLNEDGLAFDMASWSAVEPNIAIAPLVWTAVPSGLKTYPTSVTDVPAASITRGVVDLNDYFAGNSRIIGGGFEIHNVTNKLQVKGTCTVYRLPQTYTPSSLGYYDRVTKSDGAFINYWPQPHFTVISRMPPATADEALLLPHSKQWNAEFGSYQVFTMDFDQPNTTQFGQRHFGYFDFAGGQSAGVVGDGTSLLPGITWGVSRSLAQAQIVAAPAGTKNTVSVCAPFKVWSADTTGCFYTGLGDETTLTLTAIFIIETFPTQPSPLVTLATPPPSYDPAFFKLYKDVALMLPPGVMVGENASGDWWETVIDTVADVASSLVPGGKYVFTPLAKMVKGGITGFQAAKASKKPKPPAPKTAPGKAASERTNLAKQKANRSAKNKGKENLVYTERDQK